MSNQSFQWTVDITDGVMLNHALSQKIREQGVADTIFMRFVRPEPGYGRKKGQSITIQRVKTISEPTSAQLSTGTRIPVDQFSLSTTSVTPIELGRAVEYESLANELNNFDLQTPIQKQLKRQMTLTIDTMAAAAFQAAKIKYIPTSLAAGTWDTDGTPSTAATANVTIAHCGAIRDYLVGTLYTPPFSDGKYVGIGSVKLLRGIKNDPEFQEWRKYIKPEGVLYNSEVGMVEGIRWIEENHVLSNAKGTGSVLGEGLVFGDDAVVMAVVVDPHLRAAIPEDFGRQKAVAWYGVLEFGLVWDTANAGEANVIHITSS